MGTKLRGSRLEAEVDRARTEGNWRRVTELLDSVKHKSSGMGFMQEVLEAETKLEPYIEQLAENLKPRKENIPFFKAAVELLNEAIHERKAFPNVQLEAHLLLAKINYFSANPEEAIKIIEKSGMDSANTQFRTLRALKLVAEAYSIKGLAYETVEGQDNKKSIVCFKQAAELVMSYVGELEKSIFGPPANNAVRSVSSTSTPTSAPVAKTTEKMGDLLECTLERFASLKLRGTLVDGFFTEQGVEWYRRIISGLGDKSVGEKLQQKLSLQLAEILYRSIPVHTLHSETVSQKNKSLGFYTGSQRGYFSPTSKIEEIILLLLVTEVLATRDVVLSRSAELATSRDESLRNAKSVYNLLTIVLSSLRQYQLMSKTYERAVKVASDDKHIWFQFALIEYSQGQHLKASRIIENCLLEGEHEDKADDDLACKYMFAAVIYLRYLEQYEKAEELAIHAAKVSDCMYLRERAHLLQAIAIGQLAQEPSFVDSQRKQLQKSIDILERCVEADPHDYLAVYYSALYYANARMIDKAIDRCSHCLDINPDQPAAMMLLALLLTCGGDHKLALQHIISSLRQYPTNYGLLTIRLHLEKHYGKVEEAMSTAASLLFCWQEQELVFDREDERRSQTMDAASMKRASSVARTATASLGRDASTYFPGSLGPPAPSMVSAYSQSSQLGVDMSDSGVLSANPHSEYGFSRKTDSSDPNFAEGSSLKEAKAVAVANILVTMVEIYLDAGKISEAIPCTEHIARQLPKSPQHRYAMGRIFLERGRRETQDVALRNKYLNDAKTAFSEAVMLCPTHTDAHLYLAKTHDLRGSRELAKNQAKELVTVAPLRNDYWKYLGDLCMAYGHDEEGIEAYRIANDLISTTPILPFNTIPLVFPNGFH
ncbi:unnamed protein product, partial [Mesorhabditis spiculigera]